MEEIARMANVSKATLYYYFKSKVHLFYYVLVTGIPKDGAVPPPPESVAVHGEKDFLQLLQKRLKKDARFESIEKFTKTESSTYDLNGEIAEIIEELWDMCAKNRIQIIILEKSAFEYPELAETYDKYVRKEILNQLERYLMARMSQGVIRPLSSAAATARLIMESVSWFGWKQSWMASAPIHSKSEALPDLVSIFFKGLEKQ